MYEIYRERLYKYERAQSSARSLRMIIRENELWIKAYTKKPRLKRQAIIDKAKKDFVALVIPPKPPKEYGFDVYSKDDDYTYFAPTCNSDIAACWAQESFDGDYEIKPSKRQITSDYRGLIH